jgi:peptidyl-prolyl cis-trans isomerase D
MSIPEFKGPSGRFDREKFEQILRDNGLNEKIFMAEQRDASQRGEITDAVTHGLQIPKIMLDAIHRFQAEVRSADFIKLPASSAGVIADPTPEQIQAYFDARRAQYATQERRSLVVLALTPNALAKPEAVPDAEAQKRYDDVKDERFGAPEKREIEQILFPNETEAKAARAKIDAGASFDDILKDKSQTKQDASLGNVTRDGLVDKNVADAGFALPAGQVSAPVKAQFGVVLLRVAAITPSSVKPFSEVAPELKREIALQRARAELSRLHDVVEDQRAAGKSLTETAMSAGVATHVLEMVDSAGVDPHGAPPPQEIGNATALLKAAFASDVGVDNDAVKTPDGGYQWFEIVKVDKARQKALDEVRPEVETAWRKDETTRVLAAKAADLVKKIEAGQTLASIAAAEGNLEVKHVARVTRMGAEGLPNDVVPQVFNRPQGGAASVGAEDGGRVLFQVMGSEVPPVDYNGSELAAVKTNVKNGVVEDILGQYIAKLEDDLDVKVNPQAFSSVVGASNEAD